MGSGMRYLLFLSLSFVVITLGVQVGKNTSLYKYNSSPASGQQSGNQAGDTLFETPKNGSGFKSLCLWTDDI